MKQKGEEYHIINDIKCKIVYEKIKNTYIQIKDGEVIIKTSPRSSIKYVEDVVNSKADWINKKLQEQSRKINTTYKDGSTVRVLGKPYTLKIMYTEAKRNKLNMDNQYLYCDLNKDCKENEQENVKKLIDKLYKYIATEEVPSAMEDLKNRTGLAPLECSIKNLKATWGICSSKKKIIINQNLMAYSRHAIEYVCLHEICHLKHMNHSKKFWNMVEYYMPDYKEAKKELKN